MNSRFISRILVSLGLVGIISISGVNALFTYGTNDIEEVETQLKVSVGEFKWLGYDELPNEIEGQNHSALLNNLINRNRPKIRTVVNGAMKYFSSRGIDNIISTAIKLRTSYIEHQFYAKVIIIKYFMNLENVSQIYLDSLDNKVLGAIEQLYFSSSKQKKMLLDIGIN